MDRKILLTILTTAALFAQRGGGGPGGPGGQGATLAALRTAALPAPTNLNQYVANTEALTVLGKAFFWDMQAGSDGRTACATCHFHAGADHRLQNQLANPHEGTQSLVRPNQSLTLADFPFRRLANPNANNSPVLRDTRQVFGSAGVFQANFLDVTPGSAIDTAQAVTLRPGLFEIGGVQTRQATARNTPSVINAVFNVRNFWDGRASNTFTGGTPFGPSDPGLNAWVERSGALVSQPVRIENASLASQAVGPILNGTEMSYEGRTWTKLAQKLLTLQPLANQRVESDDSVLGPYATTENTGLAVDYPTLIAAAFQPEYWQSQTRDANGNTQMELNFPIFWGLAIQAYEATLISGNTRYDQFMDGNTAALTALEQQGLNEFRNGGSQCTQCHQGPELSAASYTNVRRRTTNNNANLPNTLGFFRLGVSPVSDDVGGAGNDGFGTPLFPTAPTNLTQGVFKAPQLRNVELTGPYFHNGGQATLEQVLEFYSRRGDFPGDGNLGTGVAQINLNGAERTQIAAFLKSLTDDRVKYERAPFDHPSLCIPIGHEEVPPGQLRQSANQQIPAATDLWALIPSSGRNGNQVPLQTFEELLQGIGNDGTRAHTLTQPCTP